MRVLVRDLWCAGRLVDRAGVPVYQRCTAFVGYAVGAGRGSVYDTDASCQVSL